MPTSKQSRNQDIARTSSREQVRNKRFTVGGGFSSNNFVTFLQFSLYFFEFCFSLQGFLIKVWLSCFSQRTSSIIDASPWRPRRECRGTTHTSTSPYNVCISKRVDHKPCYLSFSSVWSKVGIWQKAWTLTISNNTCINVVDSNWMCNTNIIF